MRIYGDALIHNQLELSGLIGLYALISRLRVISSKVVIEKAIQVTRAISEVYSQPHKTEAELEDMIHNEGVDLLGI